MDQNAISGSNEACIERRRFRMTHIIRSTAVLAALTCLFAVTTGCSHQEQARSKIPSIYQAPGSGQGKFLSDVANLPMDQRMPFIQANQATAQSLNPDQMTKLRGLLPAH